MTTDELETTIQDDLTALSRNATIKMMKAERFAAGETAWPSDFTKMKEDELKATHRAWRAERMASIASTIPANGDPIGAPLYAHEREQGASTPSSDTIDLLVLPVTQLGRECFVAAWPYAHLAKVEFVPDEQRKLDKKRVPEIAGYIKGEDGFFNSAMLTAVGENGDVTVYVDEETGLATLTIAPNARVLGGAGQHRIEGIKKAMEDSTFAANHREDSLPAVIYVNLTKDERRQMFADEGLYAKKPNRAIALNYDGRNFLGEFTKRVIASSVFSGHIDFDRQKIGKNDTAWFTFSAIVDAVSKMFDDLTPANADQRLIEAVAFWSSAGDAMISHWEAKNYATNKNALVAIARLYGFDVDWAKLHDLDWALDGEMARIGAAGGGSNGAVTALFDHLAMECVRA